MKTLFVYILIITFTGITAARTQDIDLSTKTNEFAFKIFKNISKNDKNNVFISPLGIYFSMSMAYEGAKGETAKEIQETLNLNKSRKKSHNEITKLLNDISLKNKDIITIANIAFTQEQYGFKKSFIKLLKDYNAAIKNADFKNDENREIARKEINTWISNNTNNRIVNLLAKDDITNITRLVLLNAISFKADWEKPFPSNKTHNMIFKNKNTDFICLFMNIQNKFKIYIDDEINFIEIPYKDNLASMYIILPSENKDIDNILPSLTNQKLNEYIKNSEEKLVNLYIPKFKLESKYKLKEILKDMGIEQAFSTNANLSRMNGRKNLLINDVIHQTFIDVDEVGTEASAATAVVIKEKSMRIPTEIKANRPFIYIIKEKSQGSILFIGKFNNPK